MFPEVKEELKAQLQGLGVMRVGDGKIAIRPVLVRHAVQNNLLYSSLRSSSCCWECLRPGFAGWNQSAGQPECIRRA